MGQAIGTAVLQTLFKAGVSYAAGRFSEPTRVGARARLQRLALLRRRAVDVSYTGGTTERRILFGRFRASGLDCMPAVVTGASLARLSSFLEE